MIFKCIPIFNKIQIMILLEIQIQINNNKEIKLWSIKVKFKLIEII